MTIDVTVTANSNIAPAPFPRDLYEEQLRDIDRFEIAIEQYLAGEITEDVFRVMRLNNGIYGQRQGGTNQMVRIKLPAGSIRPDQLELMADLATDFSRGWGHITTRQNIQFHFVELRRIPSLLRKLAAVGLTSREACGDTVRNVMACHLAGACPHEKLDVTPWAEATFRHFVRNPIGQRLPRKFKVNRRHPVGRGDVPSLRAQPDRPAPATQVQGQLLGLLDGLRSGDVQRRRSRCSHPRDRVW